MNPDSRSPSGVEPAATLPVPPEAGPGPIQEPRAPIWARLLFRVPTLRELAERRHHARTVEDRGRDVRLSYHGKELLFQNSVGLGDYRASFVKGEYDWLPVEGRPVVDVGASVGDTAFGFALRGARVVLAYEADASIASLLSQNVGLNAMQDRVRVYPFAVTRLTIPDLPPDGGLAPVLKMDCEGAEYGILERSSPEEIRRFSHIVMEYHFGVQRLKDRLSSLGFHVTYSGPYYPMGKMRGMAMGILRARRRRSDR